MLEQRLPVKSPRALRRQVLPGFEPGRPWSESVNRSCSKHKDCNEDWASTKAAEPGSGSHVPEPIERVVAHSQGRSRKRRTSPLRAGARSVEAPEVPSGPWDAMQGARPVSQPL